MIPLSNAEVLRVLKERKTHTEITNAIKSYLEITVPPTEVYNMEILRNTKDLESSMETLCILTNIQDISIIDSATEKKKIEKACRVDV